MAAAKVTVPELQTWFRRKNIVIYNHPVQNVTLLVIDTRLRRGMPLVFRDVPGYERNSSGAPLSLPEQPAHNCSQKPSILFVVN